MMDMTRDKFLNTGTEEKQYIGSRDKIYLDADGLITI